MDQPFVTQEMIDAEELAWDLLGKLIVQSCDRELEEYI